MTWPSSGQKSIFRGQDGCYQARDHGLKFSMVLMDSWYFASRVIRFLENEGKSWISEAKSNRLIYMNDKWITLQEYSDSLDTEKMKCFTIGNEQCLITSMATKMKRIGDVRLVISGGRNSVKFFVTDMMAWKPKRIMEMNLRRWDIKTILTQSIIIG